MLNTKNTIEKGSVLVSWSISVIFGELRTTFVDILCLEKWIKNWCLSILSILDHFSVKDFNLEIFFKRDFWKNNVLWSHCVLKYFMVEFLKNGLLRFFLKFSFENSATYEYFWFFHTQSMEYGDIIDGRAEIWWRHLPNYLF